MTVRLKEAVSADNPVVGSTFEAVLDEPVVVEGNLLVPRGANVAGRVESARASEFERTRGYLRLTLDEIAIDGRDLPIQTASLFARAKAVPARNEGSASSEDVNSAGVIHLEKGRQLTFRLTEPVYVLAARSTTAAAH